MAGGVLGVGAGILASNVVANLMAWQTNISTSAIIVGLVGALLAVLTISGVFGGHLTVPTSAS